MKILITGICGFVGSTLAKGLLDSVANIELYGIDNFVRPGSEENRLQMKRLGIKLFHVDIRVASDFETIPNVDWVIDAAANPSVLAGVDGSTSSRQLIENNFYGTINLLEYCKSNGAGFIMMSTSRVYSIEALSKLPVEPVNKSFQLHKDFIPTSEISSAGIAEAFSTKAPISLYGSTKLASEQIALEYGETFNFPVWINRCGVLAGAGQFGKADQGIFSFWINAYLRRKPLKYIGFGGNGLQVRDCLHPMDLIPLLHSQIKIGDDHTVRIVNLGGGKTNAISLAELSDWCKDQFGRHEIAAEPETRQFDIPWIIMDCNLAYQTWNWRPQTSLMKILDEIGDHARKHPNWLEISGA